MGAYDFAMVICPLLSPKYLLLPRIYGQEVFFRIKKLGYLIDHSVFINLILL